MTHSGSGDRRGGRPSGGLLAVAAAAGLAIAAIAVRAAAGATLRGAGLATAAAIGLALLFAVVALFIASKYRAHIRASEASTTALDRLRQATVAVLFAGAALVPLALMLLRRPDSGQGESPGQVLPSGRLGTFRPLPTPLRTPPQQQSRSFSFDLSALLWALLGAIGLALLILLAVLALRLLRRVPHTAPVPSAPVASGSGAEQEALADALIAGRHALGGDDARAAIIACYAAMEQSLARAGVARESADSPSDLLRRAAARDLPGLGARDAETLTDLFREARFSSHPMTEEHLAAARRALDSVTSTPAGRAGTPEVVGS